MRKIKQFCTKDSGFVDESMHRTVRRCVEGMRFNNIRIERTEINAKHRKRGDSAVNNCVRYPLFSGI